MKSHLAADGLRFFPQAKYIIVGRDTRDVLNLVHECEQKGAIVTVLDPHVSTVCTGVASVGSTATVSGPDQRWLVFRC